MGCWAIGGPMRGADGKATGWGEVDDGESMRAIRRALDLGVTFFDTADVYGAGRSERLLGEALGPDRDRVVIATKFGATFVEGNAEGTGSDSSPSYVRRACEASLARLGTDRIDLLQLHIGDLSLGESDEVAGALEDLVGEGVIRAYGWSTDNAESAEHWAKRGTCSAIQHTLNVLQDAPAILQVCERYGLASINRSPLAAGFLSGKYVPGVRVGTDDWRAQQREWSAFFTADGDVPSGEAEMSIRTLVAAICVAGFAAGSAVTQARAGVQPSVQRTGSATVDSNVDAVSALTSLSGTFSWWLYLSNGEVTALTNPSIHVAPPSGPAPPGTSAATLAAGDSLQDNLPPVPAVVTPEFDSSRVVSPGVADPGTHRQTVTITWTPQTFPLGYSESWGYVRIDGLSRSRSTGARRPSHRPSRSRSPAA